MFGFLRTLFRTGAVKGCPLARKTQASALDDIDGIPPGLDLSLVGKTGYVTFTGVFFADPKAGNVKFERPIFIVFASPEIIVANDWEYGNPYVIDRAKNLSLGCRMTAHIRLAKLAKPTPQPELSAA